MGTIEHVVLEFNIDLYELTFCIKQLAQSDQTNYIFIWETKPVLHTWVPNSWKIMTSSYIPGFYANEACFDGLSVPAIIW